MEFGDFEHMWCECVYGRNLRVCVHVCGMCNRGMGRIEKVWWSSVCNLAAHNPYSSIMNKLSFSMGAGPFWPQVLQNFH